MCYPKPGPRCAYHSRAALTVAQWRTTEAGVRVAELREKMHAGDESCRDESLREEYGKAVGDWERAGFARLHARDAYESTPKGQRELQAVALRGKGTQAGVDAQVRLESARKRRAHQMLALAQLRAGLPGRPGRACRTPP